MSTVPHAAYSGRRFYAQTVNEGRWREDAKEFPTPNLAGPDDFPALAALVKRARVVDLMFEGMSQEYLLCATTGRMDDWRACVEAALKVVTKLPPPRA